MATNSKTLLARLTLDNSEFVRGLKQSKTETAVFEGTLRAFKGILGGVAGAIGVVGGASEAFNKVINSSNAALDVYESSIASVDGMLNYFAHSIATMDFSNFIQGLQDSARYAYELSTAIQELDDSRSAMQIHRSAVGSAMIRYQLASHTGTPEEQAAAKAEVDRTIAEQIKASKVAGERVDATIRGYAQAATAKGWTTDEVEEFMREFKGGISPELRAYTTQLEELNREVQRTASQRTTTSGVGGADTMVDPIAMMRNLKEGGEAERAYNEALRRRNEFQQSNPKYARWVDLDDRLSGEMEQSLVSAILEKSGYQDMEVQFRLQQVRADKRIAGQEKALARGSGGSAGKATQQAEEGSLAWYDGKIGDLERQIKMTADLSEVRKLKEALGELKEARKEVSMELMMSVDLGGLEELQRELEKLQEEKQSLSQEIAVTTDETELNTLLAKLNDIEEREVRVRLSIDYGGIDPMVSPEPLAVTAVPTFASAMAKRGELQEELDRLSGQLRLEINPEVRVDLRGQIDKLRGQIDELNTSFNLDIKGVDQLSGLADNSTRAMDSLNSLSDASGRVTSAVGSVTSVISALSGEFDASAHGVLSWISTLLSAISQAAVSIAGLIPIKRADATADMTRAAAGAAASQSSIPFIGPALAVAAVASVIAAVSSAPKFAEGGIVGGNSFYGDKVLARLNSGELILNQRQQQALHTYINQPQQAPALAGEVEFKIRGHELVGVLNRYNRKISRS